MVDVLVVNLVDKIHLTHSFVQLEFMNFFTITEGFLLCFNAVFSSILLMSTQFLTS